MHNRISFLDSLRGVAILLVIGYHAFARWPGLVPYGAEYLYVPIFKAGWVGVQLFFLISGFVILMTLEKCQTTLSFLYRRWLRLFPAMLICSFLIYMTLDFFQERPRGHSQLEGLLPGLTFIEPEWWEAFFNWKIISLEGSFWSLYVEFKFYVFAAVIYFWRGRNALIVSLIIVYGLSLTTFLISYTGIHLPVAILQKIFRLLSFEYFGWFAAGATFYIFYVTKNKHWFLVALVIAGVSSAFVRGLTLGPALAACVVSLLFAVSLVSHKLQALLNNRLLIFFGAISYPLYLIHENAMISLVIKMGHVGLPVPGFVFPVVAIIFLSIIAFVIAKFGEPNIKKCIMYAIHNAKSAMRRKIAVPDS